MTTDNPRPGWIPAAAKGRESLRKEPLAGRHRNTMSR